jgi:hypothetical protein
MASPTILSGPAVNDTIATFLDGEGGEFTVALSRSGHTDWEVRSVAYRWACHKVASGDWQPHGELCFLNLRPRP